jgi:SAM-dependent methyltransferase
MIRSETKMSSVQDEINLKLYRRSDLVKDYATVNLHPPEAIVLVRYRDDIHRRRVLDLGCGAGRLAFYLRPLTDQYVGMDFSPHMVEYCQRNFPGLSFFQGDMRDLTRFDAGSFDTVFAINNLFDAVCHEDRLRVLDEVRRVLAAGGLLVFSAHNRNCPLGTAAPQLEFKLNPLSQLRGVVAYLRSVANHRRIKPKQRFEPDYALLNDCAHNYSVLHYYILRNVQAKQLAGAGFESIECLDESGLALRPGDDDSACSSIYYVARPKAS